MVTFWGMAGCAAWIAARLAPPAAPPGWALALAAGSVLGGGIALLNKKLYARGLFLVALLAAMVQIAAMLTAQDLLLGQGLIAGVTLMVAVALVWFAGYSRRHGWIS
jgi:hypothetical protein